MVKRYLAFLSLFIVMGCDYPYQALVRRESVVGSHCSGDSRILIIYEKPMWSKEPLRHPGTITMPTTKKSGRVCLDDYCSPIYASNDYFIVFSEVVLPEWIRAQIICPATGEVLYDSGNIDSVRGFCDEKGMSLFFFEGHAQKKPGESCCPPGVTCPSK